MENNLCFTQFFEQWNKVKIVNKKTVNFNNYSNICNFFQTGQTALSIAQKLGYISVVETLKIVTETTITTTTTTTIEEKYKVVAPEGMHETFMSDSEDEGGKFSHT